MRKERNESSAGMRRVEIPFGEELKEGDTRGL